MSEQNIKVILTMTTIPNRLNNSTLETGIGPVIVRLTTLSYDNYELHLNIPYVNNKINQEYIIPEWLQNYPSDKLKIFRTEDHGPVTKILPTLKRIEDPEQIIITIDDDLEYMDGFIEYHLLKRNDYPDYALGFAGVGSVYGECHFCTTLPKDVRVKILEGYKTASYKRNFFGEDFEEFSKGSWSDDIIISAYLGKNDIKKFVMNYHLDDNFSARVESFPVVRILPNEAGGCHEFRKEDIYDNSSNYYKLGFLEK
jgi:hypothetical protein